MNKCMKKIRSVTIGANNNYCQHLTYFIILKIIKRLFNFMYDFHNIYKFISVKKNQMNKKHPPPTVITKIRINRKVTIISLRGRFN